MCPLTTPTKSYPHKFNYYDLFFAMPSALAKFAKVKFMQKVCTVFLWWLKDEVTNLCRILRYQGCDDMVVLGLLLGYASCGELCFHLCKPDLWVDGPEW